VGTWGGVEGGELSVGSWDELFLISLFFLVDAGDFLLEGDVATVPPVLFAFRG